MRSKTTMRWLFLAMALLFSRASAAEVLVERFSPPAGFERADVAQGSFAQWLRRLPLLPAGTPVKAFDGRVIAGARAAAVVDLDVGERDLQQCADSILRLYAEHLWASGRADEVAFHFTNGDLARWREWRGGMRPTLLAKNQTSWKKSAAADDSYESFRAYLTQVFVWAGTASLARHNPRVELAEVRGGDFFVLGGFPGHAVLVLDVARDARGRVALLLGQGFMPAQSFHVVAQPDGGAWWVLDPHGGELRVPSWPEPFPASSLRRFAGSGAR